MGLEEGILVDSQAMEATERLLAAGKRAKEEFARIVASVRAWDRYFRLRLVVVSTWAALALLAIGIARSGGETSNPLKAYVALRQSSLGWALLVHNQSNRPWREVTIELDGGHVHGRETIGPDEKLVLSPWQFQMPGGGEGPGVPPKAVSLRVGRTEVRPPLHREMRD